MRTMKILALSTLVVGFMATSAFAGGACGEKSADTAAARNAAEAQVAGSGGCSSSASTASATKTASSDCSSNASATKTASAGCSTSAAATAQTASAGCASSAATAQTAGAGCASSTATAQTAGAGHCSSEANSAKSAVRLETVRMPSGAMAVFYHGKTAEAVAYLQASAKGGCQGFACDVAKRVAADEHCKVEMAATETGVMMLVTGDTNDVVDGYEAQYAAVIASADQGE